MKQELKNFLRRSVWEKTCRNVWESVCEITWKDVAVCVATAAAVYLVYIMVEYWPEIMNGFRQGWESRQ